jgi:hypothetical protein
MGSKYDFIQLKKEVCGAWYVISENWKLDYPNVIVISTADLFETNMTNEIQAIRVKALELSLSVSNMNKIHDFHQ